VVQNSVRGLACSIVAGLVLAACSPAERPDHFRVVVLEGTSYERGYQYGEICGSEARSFYTQMLTSSIMPYLNRERPDIASLLSVYNEPRYNDGQFSYLLMLEAAEVMAESMPIDLIEEMEGFADGSGMPYEEVLILNTFFETMITLRSVTFFIRFSEAPYLASVTFDEGVAGDEVDNDGDGETDEEGEAVISYAPSPWASMVEVPADAPIRLVLIDQAGAAAALGLDDAREPEGVDPESVRLQVNEDVVEFGDPRLELNEIDVDGQSGIEAVFTPEGGFEEASVVSVLVMSGDLGLVTDPPPSHARFMRDERFVFTTEGYGCEIDEVGNQGYRDGRTQPPAITFGVRESATPDGVPRLAHNFAMLDANTSHKHTIITVHVPEEGHPHAVLGWTGLIWGFSGMNTAGVAFGAASSDSLDNGMTIDIIGNIGDLSNARLVMQGMPFGFSGRKMLSEASSVDEATELLRGDSRTLGWNVMLADGTGAIRAIEMDANIMGATDGGFFTYEPDDSGEKQSIASVGPDDLRMASHFIVNDEDFDLMFLRPQRYWSSFYLRSLRAYYILGTELDHRYGLLDTEESIAVLSLTDLVDIRDGAHSVVFEPTTGHFHVAMGQVPPTDGAFHELDLAELVASGGGMQ